MSDLVVEKVIEPFEEEIAKSFSERFGKVVVVGLVSLIAVTLAEKAYDGYFERRNNTKESQC